MNQCESTVAHLGYLKISIVTIVLNRVDFIERTIRSVLAQNYPRFEHIIIDGASTDGTVDVLKKYDHLVVVSEPDEGQVDALNKGLRLVTGDVFTWLCSDDVLNPGALATANRYLQLYPKWGAICGLLNWIDAQGNVIGGSRFHRPTGHAWLDMTGRNAAAMFFRRGVLDEIGLVDPAYKLASDYDFYVRVARRFKVGMIRERLASLCLHPGSGMVSQSKALRLEHQMIARRYYDHTLDEILLWKPYLALLSLPFRFKWWWLVTKSQSRPGRIETAHSAQ